MTLTSKVEAALAAYLAGLTMPDGFTAEQILMGENDTDKDGQIIICAASDTNEEIPPYTGNFMVPCAIELHTPAVDDGNGGTTLDLHQSVSEFLEVAFCNDGLAAALTAAQSDFTCMGFVDRKFLGGQEDGVYLSGVSLTLYCNGIAP